MKMFENHGLGRGGANRTDRQDRVYPETLRTGDVLLYANTNDGVTKESGTYAFIYLNDNFYGINSLIDGSAQNVVYAKNSGEANTLWTLFAKDYYVILRPSQTIKHSSNSTDGLESNELVNPATSDGVVGVLVIGAVTMMLVGIMIKRFGCRRGV